MNLDPEVREAYHYFYLLDYPAAVQRFEHIHKEHPGDPHATTMLLEAVVFQELYRQDLLDTTFYANDGFLTGKHATDEDPMRFLRWRTRRFEKRTGESAETRRM
jgi:hypothetical protein